MAKENDWFLTTLSNADQNLTTSDFKAAGVNADNSELLGSDVYKNLNTNQRDSLPGSGSFYLAINKSNKTV